MNITTKDIVLEALACQLNRGQWFTAPDLIELTGADSYEVREALDKLTTEGRIEARIHRADGTYGRRFVRVAP